jgi:YgiT-type zinc finger domain-containing protein
MPGYGPLLERFESKKGICMASILKRLRQKVTDRAYYLSSPDTMRAAMTCDFCQGETRTRRVKKYHRYKGGLYVVENVPAEVCPGCGERYFHAKTLDAIDRLLESDHPVKETLQVEVVSL